MKNNETPLSRMDAAATIILSVGVFILAFYTTLCAKNMDSDGAISLAIPLGICAGSLEMYIAKIRGPYRRKSTVVDDDDKLQ